MHSVFALVSLVFATTSLAAPALEQRQAPCVSSLNARFAFSASTIEHNETIALGLISVPSAPPGSVSVLAAGSPDNVLFQLDQSRIAAFNDPNFRGVSSGAVSGSPVTFIQGPPGPPGLLEPYCAQLGGPVTTYLGVGGDIRNFALCQSTDNRPQVVYRPSAANDGSYRFDTCDKVLVRIHELLD